MNRVNFDLAKVSKININFELLKTSKMTSLKIYISPVMEKLETSNLDSRVPLSTSPWKVVMSWAHNHITYISSYKEVSPVIERPHGLCSSTQMLRSSSISCFKYFVIINFSKFCKTDKLSCSRWPACWVLYLYMKQAN